MQSFKEFLQEQGTQARADYEAGASTIAAWVADVTDLLDRITAWIGESDPEHIVRIERLVEVKSEFAFGPYQIDALTLRFGKVVVTSHPVAIRTLGPPVQANRRNMDRTN